MIGDPAPTTPPTVVMRTFLTMPRTGDFSVVRCTASTLATCCGASWASSPLTRSSSVAASCRKRFRRSCTCISSSLRWRSSRMTSTSDIRPRSAIWRAVASSCSSSAMLLRLADTESSSTRRRACSASVSAATMVAPAAPAARSSAGTLSAARPFASAESRAAVPSSDHWRARPSFCWAATRVGSSWTRSVPTSTRSPSRTSTARSSPPSRLAMTCSWPSGTTLPCARVITSTGDRAAQTPAAATSRHSR